MISAVISNVSAVGNWLNGENSEVVNGATLTPTDRTLAFTSWLDTLGRIEFVSPRDIEEREFFVPRIIEQVELKLRGRERKRQFFPEKNGTDIALYLGLKLAQNGGVAIFCGKKSSASGLCDRVCDIFERGLNTSKPIIYSDSREIEKIRYLHERNLGKSAPETRSAAMGILAHHANIPHGIRLAVEYALTENLARFVICTSTLAQGVNLPIKYLIVTSLYQGLEKIKVRDFHNLIGRAGRQGMFTEGSTIFADPLIYDKRTSFAERWRWGQVKNLLDTSRSEPCASSLHKFFEPLSNEDGSQEILLNPCRLAEAYVAGKDHLPPLKKSLVSAGFTIEGLQAQVNERIHLMAAIESYLMAQWESFALESSESGIETLAKSTFAYFLANDEEKNQLVSIFKILAQSIHGKIADNEKKKVFAKTLYGVRTALLIEKWVNENIEQLVVFEDDSDQLLAFLWPVVESVVEQSTFKKCNPSELLYFVAEGWVNGKSYIDLFEIMGKENAKIGFGLKPRKVTISHVVELCDGAFSYDGSLLVGAIAEIVAYIRPEAANIVFALHSLQKRLKYGLPSKSAIILYEMGFTDRIIALELNEIVGNGLDARKKVLRAIKRNVSAASACLEHYPAYFSKIMKSL